MKDNSFFANFECRTGPEPSRRRQRIVLCSADTTRKILNVKTIVLANTKAPQATCATVTATIGVRGCGSNGDLARTTYAAIPRDNCTSNNVAANSAGRVRYLSPRWRVNTRATVAPSTSVTTNAPPTCASTKASGRFWSQVAECLNVAPNTSCTRITASASTLNGLNDAFSTLRSG